MAAQRILHVVGKFSSGGVESMISSYLSAIDRAQYIFDIAYEKSDDSRLPKFLSDMGVKGWPMPPVTRPLAYLREMRRVIRQGGYTIVHSDYNSFSFMPLLAAKLVGVKVRICHNHTTSSPAERLRHFVKCALRLPCRLTANRWCACSEAAARFMYGDIAFDSGRVTVFRNGIDVSKFAYKPAGRISVRREFEIENKTVLGHVGRFVTTKNHRFLIDLFAEYSAVKHDSVLFLVGEGELESDIKNYVTEKKLDSKVIFAELRNDMPEVYSAFDYFLLPSLYEGMPVVLPEAVTSGLPCLIADTVTRECSDIGRIQYLPINDPSIWADALQKIDMSDECYRKDSERSMRGGPYDINECAEELERYYRECLENV